MKALETDIGKALAGWGGLDHLAGVGQTMEWLRRRADELERGGDR